MISSTVEKSKENIKKLYNEGQESGYFDEAYFEREVWRNYGFSPEAGFLAYYMPFYARNPEGFITNIIDVTVSSGNPEVQYLIDELRESYDYFVNLLEKKEQ